MAWAILWGGEKETLGLEVHTDPRPVCVSFVYLQASTLDNKHEYFRNLASGQRFGAGTKKP